MNYKNVKNKGYENYKNFKDKLNCEYKTTFEKIEAYINASVKIDIISKNNCFMQILDSFLEGQDAGNDVCTITGADLKKYCEDMIYGETIYIHKLSKISSHIFIAIFYVLIIYILTNLFKGVEFKNYRLIFKSFNFGLSEVILIIGFFCIPFITSSISKNYFENPIKLRRVEKITYFIVLFIISEIYLLFKNYFQKFTVSISFEKIILIFIYFALIVFLIFILSKTFESDKLENKYLMLLNKQYEKYKEKCKNHYKNPLEWSEFIKKKQKINFIYLIVFFVYSIIFLVFTILICRSMIINGISADGIILLIICYIFDILLSGIVMEGMLRKNLY